MEEEVEVDSCAGIDPTLLEIAVRDCPNSPPEGNGTTRREDPDTGLLCDFPISVLGTSGSMRRDDARLRLTASLGGVKSATACAGSRLRCDWPISTAYKGTTRRDDDGDDDGAMLLCDCPITAADCGERTSLCEGGGLPCGCHTSAGCSAGVIIILEACAGGCIGGGNEEEEVGQCIICA